MGLDRGIDDLGEFAAAQDTDPLGTQFPGQPSEQLFTRQEKAILLGESRRRDCARRRLGRGRRAGVRNRYRASVGHRCASDLRRRRAPIVRGSRRDGRRCRIGRIGERLRAPRKHGDARVEPIFRHGAFEEGYHSEGRAKTRFLAAAGAEPTSRPVNCRSSRMIALRGAATGRGWPELAAALADLGS